MGFMQTIKQALSNHCETFDQHPDEQLRTHYYKTTSSNGFKFIKEMVEKLEGFELIAASEERGEISVNVKKGRKAFMVITIISVRPFETAVDFSVTTDSVVPVDFGYSKALVKRMYEMLDQKLVLVKTGDSAKK